MEEASKGKRASENQKEYLINYLEENLDIANDKFVTVDDARHRDEKWKKLAATLNALGGTQKDGQKWKKYFLKGRSFEEEETIVADETVGDSATTSTLAANSTEARQSNIASVLTTASTSTTEPTRSTCPRKRKQQYDSLPLEKHCKIDEKKLDELKTANNLKCEQIAILKEQVKATKIQTEAIKSNTQVKENLVGMLQQLIKVLVEQKKTQT